MLILKTLLVICGCFNLLIGLLVYNMDKFTEDVKDLDPRIMKVVGGIFIGIFVVIIISAMNL